ncbi:MAG TPA: phosphatase PAP2 family protein [Pyrinomonadaceae bacterium]|jgi:membrane-associated phospholipid phosphatase
MKTEDVPKRVKIARIVSVAGHPFVLLTLTVFIAALHRTNPIRALTLGGAAVLFTVSPLVFIIRRKVSAGKWSDHDISDASERRSFYPIAIGIAALSTFLFYLLDFPHGLIVGMLMSLVIMLAAMLINRRSKISLHMIFAAYFAIALFGVSLWSGTGFLLLAAAVGWSRVVLERHTPAQVLSGAVLGATAGIVLLKITGVF